MRLHPLQQLTQAGRLSVLALALCIGSASPAWSQQKTDTPYSTQQIGEQFGEQFGEQADDALQQPAPDTLITRPTPLFVPVIEQEIEKPPSGAVGILRAVDKITARVTDIKAPLDQVAQFGTLQITMRYCYKNPPEDTPEVTAFLEVEDHQPDRQPAKTFTGWMFASSPALSAMEHPVYDVWVIDCKASAPESSGGKALNSP